jgi:hypothetical protein
MRVAVHTIAGLQVQQCGDRHGVPAAASWYNPRMRRGLLLLLLAAFACTASPPEKKPVEMPPTPETSPRCREIDMQLSEALATAAGGTCATDADCALIGGQVGEPTCDCAPFLVDCGGMPMPTNAPGLERVTSLLNEFRAAGCATGTACGCNIRSPLRCSAEKRCVADARTCTIDEVPTGW